MAGEMSNLDYIMRCIGIGGPVCAICEKPLARPDEERTDNRFCQCAWQYGADDKGKEVPMSESTRTDPVVAAMQPATDALTALNDMLQYAIDALFEIAFEKSRRCQCSECGDSIGEDMRICARDALFTLAAMGRKGNSDA